MLSCTHFPSKKRARDRHGQKRSASCVYRPSSANALNLKRHRLAFWPETELSKIERSFKLISVVLLERGSKETLGARFLAQSVGIPKKFHRENWCWSKLCHFSLRRFVELKPFAKTLSNIRAGTKRFSQLNITPSPTG